MANHAPALAVDSLLPDILDSLSRHPNFVVEAAPGSGKTTRIPPALLTALSGEVVVLEPRRIAARLAARRVAWERNESVGETVGYQVRFEEVAGPRTRLRYVTEGILTRRLLSDPLLKGVSAVVLDEFHERHLETDLALALLRRLQIQRPELKLIVMSATLDARPVAQFLGDCPGGVCPVLRSEGRRFELAVEHLPYSPAPLERQVGEAFERLSAHPEVSGILAFLPGALEIRRAMRECEATAARAGYAIFPLHGSLPPAEQDRALAPSEKPKLILATNIAESSITVEGVNAVIDSGLARIAGASAWSGLPTLHVGRISKASAVQRSGRAARTGPGWALRLYSAEDFSRRPEHDMPEILRADLSQLCLALRAMSTGVNELQWLDAPPADSVRTAEALLDRLGARGERAAQLARFPLPPRLSRIVVESIEQGVGEEGCVAAAVLASGTQSSTNDLLTAMEREMDGRTRQQMEQLRKIARPARRGKHNDDALLRAVLTGFPDRVARRRAGKQLLLSSGASAEMVGEAPHYEFMVVVDAEERGEQRLPLVRMAARIQPEWLIDLFPEQVREQVGLVWNHKAERVDAVSALLYDELVIEESRGAAPEKDAAAEMLAQKALEAGLERFVDMDALQQFLARAEFAGFDPPDLRQQLQEMCAGLRSFAQLKSEAENFVSALEAKIGLRRLNELAPERLPLRNGRAARVHYERGKPPWIASRLQDFFGMKESPRIGRERTPVVIHLLAPNQRPVQTTADLAGFWERLYPQVRRELMRRYPKHAWPERP